MNLRKTTQVRKLEKLNKFKNVEIDLQFKPKTLISNSTVHSEQATDKLIGTRLAHRGQKAVYPHYGKNCQPIRAY